MSGNKIDPNFQNDLGKYLSSYISNVLKEQGKLFDIVEIQENGIKGKSDQRYSIIVYAPTENSLKVCTPNGKRGIPIAQVDIDLNNNDKRFHLYNQISGDDVYMPRGLIKCFEQLIKKSLDKCVLFPQDTKAVCIA